MRQIYGQMCQFCAQKGCVSPQMSSAVLADLCKSGNSRLAADVTLHELSNDVCRCCFFTHNTLPLQACTVQGVS